MLTPRILVTTDFTTASEQAFYHALAFAVSKQARLTLLHTGSESRSSVPWEKFPGVRDTLTKWGLLSADAPRAAVIEQLKLDVAKMAMRDDNPREGITDYLRRHPTDLLVMASEGRHGFTRLFSSSVAETVCRRTRSHTLMLPKRGTGFVDSETGQARLERILCIVDPATDPRQAFAYLTQWLPAFGGREVDVIVVAMNDNHELDAVLPEPPGQYWRYQQAQGDIKQRTTSAVNDADADLVAIITRKPRGLVTRIRDNLIDVVLKELRLPLLSVPAD